MSFNRPRSSNSVRKRICRKALILLLIIGIPLTVFLFFFGIKKAEVIGESRYSDSQIREMVLKSRFEHNSIYLYLKYHFFAKPQIPFVEKLDVEMNSNHDVTIYVYEKMVTGCVYAMNEYLYFDKDGIIVESSPKKIEKAPVIEGLHFNEIILHQKLNLLSRDNSVNHNEEQFNAILNLTKLINKYTLNVDTVRFDEEDNVTLLCGNIRILLGKKSDYEEALSDLKNILANAKGTDLYELDMTDYHKDTGYVIGKSKNSTE